MVQPGLCQIVSKLMIRWENCFVTCSLFFAIEKALWTKNGGCIVYPCHAIIVSIDVSSGQQLFFMGHTNKVLLKEFLEELDHVYCR